MSWLSAIGVFLIEVWITLTCSTFFAIRQIFRVLLYHVQNHKGGRNNKVQRSSTFLRLTSGTIGRLQAGRLEFSSQSCTDKARERNSQCELYKSHSNRLLFTRMRIRPPWPENNIGPRVARHSSAESYTIGLIIYAHFVFWEYYYEAVCQPSPQRVLHRCPKWYLQQRITIYHYLS